MTVNSNLFTLGSLTLQSGASENRVFNASGGGGISLSLGFTNQSSATQTFNVPIEVSAGTVDFVSTSTGNTAFTGDFSLGANTAAFSGSGNFSISGTASGTGGLTKSGAGTLTLSGNNTFTGVLTVAEGKLTVSTINNANEAGVLGESGNAVVLGSSGQTGFLHYIGIPNASSTKKFTAAGGGTAGIEASNAATSLTLSGVIDGTGNVQKGGAGTIILAGENTFSGALNIHDGTVQVGALSGLGDGTSIGIGKSGTDNVSTLRYTGGSATTTKNISLSSSNNVSGIIDVANSDATLSVEGQISGSSGLTKSGAGTLTLSGNNTFTGVLTVAEGKLTVSTINNANQAGVLGESGNAVVLGSSGQTGFLHYIGTTNASSTKNFTAADGGTAGIEASNAATSLTLSGVIDGTGNVQKGGAGTIILDGVNTFSGALNIHDGTVQVGALSGLGNATSIGIGKSGTENVSTLRYTGNTATISQNIALESSNNVSGVIDVATSGQTLTVSGQISGSSGLNKTGIGRLNLSANSSYTGPTTVSAGSLQLSGGSIASSVSVSSGASLSGYGSVGTLGGAGSIDPGNSPGIVTATQVNPSAGTDYNFELTGLAPTFNNAANSVNDLIRITGATPFSESLAAGNIINVYFSGDALFTGSTAVQYKGGFFTDTPANFSSSIASATYNYFFANAAGTTSYNGVNFYTQNQYETFVLGGTNMLISVSTVAQSADFGNGTINGQIMQIDVIPEPSTYALLGLSALALGAYRWRRRRRAN
jgi:autotransporter-associated beta strand protein